VSNLPAFSVSAVSRPGNRLAALELVRAIERRGFAGVYCSAAGAGMALCHSIAHVTSTLRFGTAIVNIYSRNPVELAQSAAYLHELSGGRFTLGLGVAHAPFNEVLGAQTDKPLGDMRDFVERLRAAGPQHGGLPPVVLATLRRRMVALAAEIADGAVFANVPLRRAADALVPIPADRRKAGFFVGNIVPVCVADDRAAAAEVMRRTVSRFVVLPNYRNYWKEAGYAAEVERLEQALAAGGPEAAVASVDDRWLEDVTLFGPARDVCEGIEAWQAAGFVPILAPSSTSGDPTRAFVEVMAAFA
jgi:alkanesulfonate monooxygenase SsuD/methylene tetrahydromethanopterin reductase-like flavin-dependent oxidoreductase (luciferase family)